MIKELRVNFNAVLSQVFLIDSDTAGTYTKEFTSGGLNISYEINTIPVTLPFTVVATDSLRVISDVAGFVLLE